MPELPEVETIRRHLAPYVEGRRLDRLEILDPRWCRPLAPAELAATTQGRVVERLSRRGKYLVWELEGDVFLLAHLRMTGALLLAPRMPSAGTGTRRTSPAGTGTRRTSSAGTGDLPGAPPHTRVWFTLGDRRLAFTDPRRFGTGELALGPEARDAFFAARLGEEPFSAAFTGAHLHSLAAGSRAPVKAFLLDQRKVAGVGNIYADEALFRAGIHPLRPAGRLTRAQWEALRDAVVASLEAGVAAKGATIDDFRHPDGVRGSFQDQFLVHRREGQPCPECGRPVRKLRAAGRGTYVCERCQPVPRRRRYAASASSARRPARSA